jgi:hypothetical protein
MIVTSLPSLRSLEAYHAAELLDQPLGDLLGREPLGTREELDRPRLHGLLRLLGLCLCRCARPVSHVHRVGRGLFLGLLHIAGLDGKVDQRLLQLLDRLLPGLEGLLAQVRAAICSP